MSEMVERVARAICQNVHGGNDPCAEDYQAARAAIEAMREPTDEMRLASKRYKRKAKVYSGPACYREMIDAALASEPKP